MRGRRASGESLFNQAIEENDQAQVRFALKYFSSKVNDQDENGVTALHRSCMYGRLEIARLLLDHGVELEAKDSKGWTALHFAANAGHLELANFLICSCANVSAMTYDGKLAIDLAKGEGMVFLLAAAIIQAGKEELLIRYMDDPVTSLQSLQEEDENHNKEFCGRRSASLEPLRAVSGDLKRASVELMCGSFGAYLDEKFNLKSSLVSLGILGEEELNEPKLRKVSCPQKCGEASAEGSDRAKTMKSARARPKLCSFNSAFSMDVLQRSAVSETNLAGAGVVGETLPRKATNINRVKNFVDLKMVGSDVLM